MARSLQEYQRKRDFAATPEPSGGESSASGADSLRFCIQKHDASHLHYDFRLELDGTLKSWAVPKGPSLDPAQRRLAVQVEDHPLDYASFEGHIPDGHYGAGDVIVWDCGVWETDDDPSAAYASGKLHLHLHGQKLNGAWNLFRTGMAGKRTQWLLVKVDDAQARSVADYDVLEAEPDSVLSDATLAGAHAKADTSVAASRAPAKRAAAHAKRSKRPPPSLRPQLATLVDTPPAGDWRYEVKFDGYRVLARIQGSQVRLFTRNGHDWSARLPRQIAALKALKLKNGWLDGEVVVADAQGATDFQALQNAFERDDDSALTYYLFDLPWLDGEDLRCMPLEHRRQRLRQLLEANADDALRYSEDFDAAPQALLASACELRLEGLIGKRVGSLYQETRSRDWIKLKCQQRQEFVVVGYTDPQGSRQGFGALLLALHTDDGELRYAGRVGSGFDEATLSALPKRLKALKTAKPTLRNAPTGAALRGVHWLRPQLLAEVAFAQMTRSGSVRHAVFKGLRDDKPARAIHQERAQPSANAASGVTAPTHAVPADLHLTHPERVIDPHSGTTKRQIAEYYAAVAPWILPHLRQRPVALVRAPEGLGGELFFQKHSSQLHGLRHYTKAQAGQAAMVVPDAAALLGAVQMNALELHTWNATDKAFDKPDRFILDLDPGASLPWKAMLEAAELTLTLLDTLGLRAFIKTSGGKGLHLVVPLTRRAGWDTVKAFSNAISQHLADLFPDRFTAVAGPDNRRGKVFVDYLRNGLGATTVCAYSVRARPGLGVSMPISRAELPLLASADQWHVGDALQRLHDLDDPWADLPRTRQSITQAMRRQLGLDP